MTKRLADILYDYVAASFPGLWVESYEHEDACAELRELCRAHGWVYLQWDADMGLLKDIPVEGGVWQLCKVKVEETVDSSGRQLRRIVQLKAGERPQLDFAGVIRGLNVANCDPEGNRIFSDDNELAAALLVVKNIHGFVGSVPVLQLLANALWEAKSNRQVLVGLTHTRQIPAEVEKLFQVIEHPLPDTNQLREIALGIGTDEGETPQDEDSWNHLIDAAAGLTRFEAEGAYSLSLVRHSELLPRPVFELKANMLKKGTGALTLYQGTENFQQVGGLQHLKLFCQETLSGRESEPDFRPKGVMLMGVSGAGKSLFAKALGREVGRPTLCCDIGAVMGRYVGQSEENMRRMLRVADAMSPCILFIDEAEKALAGAGSSGSTDSGVKAGVFGTLLSWMNDHTSDVYVIMTVNDVTKLTEDNPEFVRQERFDGMFFIDFPGREAKDQIWELYLRKYGFLQPKQTLADLEQPLPDDLEMTGAEIRSICRLARLRQRALAHVGKTSPKIADQAFEAIDRTRTWATGKCWSAEHEELYDKEKYAQKLAAFASLNETRRSVNRKRNNTHLN